MNLKRTEFIKDLSIIGAALPFADLSSPGYVNEKKNFPIYFFTKPLDEFEISFISECLAMAGLDGYDLSVRPKGKVEPEKIVDDLPKIIEVGRKYNLSTEMMVTSITNVNDRHTETVLKTASSLGIKHYRMGYYDFDLKEGIPKSLQRIRNNFEQLADLNRQYKIQAGYQNHSGVKVGAPLWDVYQLLQDLPVSSVSSQFDIRHAVTEGANSWLLSMHLLSKNIGSLAIKDFTWQIVNGKARVVSVPLGEGIVDFENYFKTLKELGLTAPISLHIEYPLFSRQEEGMALLEKQKIVVRKLKKDVDFIRGNLNKFKLA